MGVDAAAPDGALSEPGPVDPDESESVPYPDGESADPAAAEAGATRPETGLRLPALAIALVVIALAGLTTYLGVQAYRSHQQAEQRNLLLQVARQGAINLTTIDFEHADADIQRILASATGPFYDDFSQRSQPFVDVVKRAQSKSVGTVTEAGMESFSGNEAQVLVAVAVTTTNVGAPESSPRNWRMRVSVEKVGDEAKVSDVQFVP